MKRSFLFSTRIFVLAVCVLSGFIGLQARLFYLQVKESDYYNDFAQRNRNREKVKQAKRGNIFDASGNLLATTRSFIELGVDPRSVTENDIKKIPELSKIIGVPENTILSIINRKERQSATDPERKTEIRWAKIVEKLDEDIYIKVQKLGLKSVYGNRIYERVYPHGQLAAHVLGYLNKEGTPTFGIERQLDKYLRGIDGWYDTENDRKNREIAHFRKREVEPMDGWNVELSIDTVIQSIIEEEIKRVVTEFSPQNVSIIVSEPKTGFILGLANYPTFDLNNYSTAPLEAQRNRAVTDVFEPGSTFKIVAVSSAIQEKVVRPIDQFDCGVNTVLYRGKTLSLPRDSHHEGVLTVAQIIQKSSNKGSVLVALRFCERLGEEKFYEYVTRYGFGSKTDSGFSGEVSGILYPPKLWDGLTITRLPMGHAIAATAMQVNYAMGSIANNGKLMRPQVVRRIYQQNSDSGGISFPPVERRQVLEPWAAKEMATMLTAVTKPGGTAMRASVQGFEVAGKTGTTQKIINGRYSSTDHVASFTGFFPAQNPQYQITIIIDGGKPKSGGIAYGGIVSAPSFRKIAEQIVKYKGMIPDIPDSRATSNLN